MSARGTAAFLLLALAPVATAQLPDGFAPAWDKAVAHLRGECERLHIVGASLAFVRGREVLGEAHHGFADLEAQRPADGDTIYHWASITKTFTAVALMQLRDRGLLSLDDSILDYAPELAAAHNPFGPMRAITLRHLLTHSAGFRSPTWPWGGSEPWHPHEPAEWSQLVAMMPYTEVQFEPGSRFAYSNPGIVFAARAFPRLTGDDYEAYMHKNVLAPLGMTRSSFDRTPWHLRRHRANNYRIDNGAPAANGLDFDTGITVSNGGLNAPIRDFVKYLAFLLGDVDQGSDAAAVLAPASLEEMWQPRLAAGAEGDAIGLCFFVTDRRGQRFVGHTGGQKAFVSFFYVHPASRTGAVAAFNTATAGPLLRSLRALLLDEVTPLFLPPAKRS